MADTLDFSSQATPYVPPKPLDFSGQASLLPQDQPGLVSQATSAVGRGFGDIGRGVVAGYEQARQKLIADINRPTDMSVGGEPGIVQDITEPLAPAAHLAQIGMDVPNLLVQAGIGAFHPLAQPTGEALLKIDPRYSSEELAKMTPQQRTELATSEGEEFQQNLAGVAMAGEGGIRGVRPTEINPEQFAPVPEKSIYTTVVPPKVVPTGPLADMATAHSPVGAVLDAFGEGPTSNWGAPDYVAKMDTKAAPADVVKALAQGQEEVSKGFNEAFQRSAASQALVQAPDLAPQLAEARSFGIIGEGEGGWSGLVTPDPAAAEARRIAANMVEPEGPQAPAFDIHETARQLQPDLFHGEEGYDTLDQQRETLRNSLLDLTEQRSAEAVKDIDARLAEFPGEHPEQVFDKAADLMDQREDVLARARRSEDTPEMAQLRQAIQATDVKMRDLGPRVNAAYRDAEARGPIEPPVAIPAEAVAATPTEAPTPTPATAEAAPAASPASAEPHPVPANVAADVSQKLVAAGRPAEEANAAGQLVAAHYDARAARFDGKLGTGPELYAREAPEIKAGRTKVAAPEKEFAQTARGKIAFRDAQSTITLMKDANASTFIHETGHQWLEEMMRDAKDERAPGDLTKDAQTVRGYLGVKEGEEISTRQHEKFARSFERYMMEGTAPSKGLADVFAKFKNWLTQIYQTVTKLRAPITDDIRQVFDRLLTSGDEKTVIAPEREPGQTFADMHEAEAKHTTPEHADPVGDNVEHEVVQLARPRVPDVADKLSDAGETGGISAQAGGDTGGPRPTGTGPGEAGDADKPGEVSGGGGTTAAEGPVVGAKSGTKADDGRASAIPGPNSDLIDKAGNIRLDNINTPEDFKQALRDAADRNNNFLERRRDVVTDAQRDSLATVMGTTPDKVISKAVGQSFSDSEIKMLEKALADSAATVHALSVKAAVGGEAEILAMTEAYLRHDMIQGAYSQATAEAGRALRALRKSQEFWTKDALATKSIIEQQVGDATGRTLYQMRAIARKIAQLDDPGQISKAVRDTNRKGLFDWLQAAFVNALNSGPLTHLGYTSASEMFALFRATAETGAAALVGKIRETAGYGPQEYASIHEVPHQLYGMYRGAQAGIKASWQAVKSNEVVLPKEVQDLQGRSSTTGQPINSTRVIPNPVVAGRAIPIGTVLESPGRMIAALHSFNWTTFYSQSIAGQAFRQALSEGIDLNSPRFGDRVAKLTMSPTDAMVEEASNDANGGALMNRAEHGTFMAKVSALTNHGIAFPDIPLGNGKSFPLGTFRPLKYIDPFVQIQANVQKAAFGRGTPLALFSQAVRDDLSMKNGGVAFDRTAGRILAGTTFMVAAGGLAAQGILNASGPSKPKELALWQRVNGMPHGLTIGNMSYDVLRLGNLGLQMSVAADLFQVAHAIGEGDAARATSQVVEAFAQNIMDESSMRGPSEMMKAIDDKDRYGAAWIRNFAASAIPFSTGLSQLSHQVDPYSREARTTMDAIKAKIPFESETLQPRYDVWGVQVPNRGWAVTPTQPLSQDPVDRHLLALRLYPSVPRREITGVKLTDQQYADYCRMSGQLAHRLVSRLIGTPGFDNIPVEERVKQFDGAIDYARKQAASTIQKSSAGTTNDIYAQALAAKKAGMH